MYSVVIVVADCYSFSTSKKRNRVSGGDLQGLSKWNATKRAAITKKKNSARLFPVAFR